MLNILVCVKQVPDVNLVKIDPVTGSLIRQGVPSIMNPGDSCALEAAVQVKEQYGGTLTCISMGPDMAEEVLREGIAGGADRAVLLSDRAFANADTLATSYVIVSAAKQLGDFDLIFCGKESLDGATGQMGSQLAERFGANQVSGLNKLLTVDEKNRTVTAERLLDDGVETVEAKYPCLFTVEKSGFRARIPNLISWLSSRSAEIVKLDASGIAGLDREQIGDAGSPTKVPRTYPPVTGETGQMISEGSAGADAAKLLSLLGDII